MNPMFYGTLNFLAFVAPMVAVGLWLRRDLRRTAAKRAAGFATTDPETRSRRVE